MTSHTISMRIAGPSTDQLAREIAARRELIPVGTPKRVFVNDAPVETQLPAAVLNSLDGNYREVFFKYPACQYFSVHSVVATEFHAEDGALRAIRDSMRGDLSFLLWTISLHEQEWSELSLRSVADHLGPHGFASAFRGAGHDRLVSRRWLEYGPWRLIRDEDNDISFVQFHDLEADAETALAQARPGHERMGISPTGGFIQSIYSRARELNGLYVPDERVLEIPITGREVSQDEMLQACQVRYHQVLGSEKPLDNVRYVFVMGEEPAREHLHELWLRELECWAIVDGEKVRLDDTYEPPPPETPAWVAEVEAREAAAE